MSVPSVDAHALVDSLVHRLVDADAGDEADHLLVQRDRHAVVVALGDERKPVVLLPCDEPTREAVLLARAQEARTRDTDDVWNGLSFDACHLVIVGAPPSPEWTPTQQPADPALGRPLAWHHLGLDRVLKSPADAPLPDLAALLADTAAVHPVPTASLVAAERAGEQALGRLSLFRAALADRGAPLTIALIAAWVVVAIAQEFFGGHDSAPTLLRLGASSGREVLQDGEWWRVFSASMLHGGVHHVIGNVYGALMFGSILEAIVGPSRLLVGFALSVAAGGYVSAWSIGDGLSIGASGGVFGLMGMAVGLSIGARGLVPAPERKGVLRISLFYLAINALFSLMPGVDWAAHLGGLVAGFVFTASRLLTLGLPPVWERGAAGPGQWLYRLLGAGSLALLFGAVFFNASRTDAVELFGAVSYTRVAFDVGGHALSLDVPRGAATRPGADEPGDGFARKTWGSGRVDPVTVSLLAWPVEPPPEDVRAYLESEMPNFTPVEEGQGGALEWVDVNGRPFLFRREGDGRHPWLRWRGVVGHHLVDLLVSVMPDARDKWNEAPEHVVGSLQSK